MKKDYQVIVKAQDGSVADKMGIKTMVWSHCKTLKYATELISQLKSTGIYAWLKTVEEGE